MPGIYKECVVPTIRWFWQDPITAANVLRWLAFATILEASCKVLKMQAEDRIG